MTNGDKIRQMSDEELAEYLYDGNCPTRECQAPLCKDCWLKWLKSEVEK